MWEGIQVIYFAYRSNLQNYVHYLYFEEEIYKEKTLQSTTTAEHYHSRKDKSHWMFSFCYSSFLITCLCSYCLLSGRIPSKCWQQCRSGGLFPQRFTLKEATPHAGVAFSHSTHRRSYACSAHFLGKLKSTNFATTTGTKAPDVIMHQSQEENPAL